MKMKTYNVRLYEMIWCENNVNVEAETAAEAALIARQMAMNGNVKVTPVEYFWPEPSVTAVGLAEGDSGEIAVSGSDGFGSCLEDCLTGYLRELLQAEGVPQHEISKVLQKLRQSY